MSITDKIKKWIYGEAEESQVRTVSVPEDIVETVKSAVAEMDPDEKDLSIINRIMSEEPMVYSDIRAVVEYYWSGFDGPEEYRFIGDKGDGAAIKWWESQLAEFENEALAEQPTSSFKVYYDQQGNPRWLGWVTNNWIDREKEIIAASAHNEFIKFLDDNPDDAPELWSWHTQGTARKNRADWWDFANGFLIMSGPLTEAEAKAYENLGDRELGMSHGFYVLKQVGNVILKYRTFEVSDLDRRHAANPYTAIQVLGENKMFNTPKRAYLVDLLGEEKVSALEEQTEDMEKALQDAGITRKDLDEKYIEYLEAEAQAKADADVETQVDDLVEQIKTALNVEQLQEILQDFATDLEALKGVKTTVESLQADIEALKETEDQRISSLFAPSKPINWAQRAATAEETVVEEEDLDPDVQKDVKEGQETMSWLQGMTVER